MKIVQICLCGSYNPKMGYQDNILPKYYAKMGFECVTVTSQYYKDKGEIKRDTTYRRQLNKNIELVRLPNKYSLSYRGNRFLRLFSGLYKFLKEEKPDIIFLHNFQFLSIRDVVRYCKENKNVKVYADSHTDYVNSATNWLSKNILHKIIWYQCAKQIEPYVIKFWGVTEQRCNFLNEVYKIPNEKCDLLVMGADDEKIRFEKKDEIRKSIREELSIANDDFVVITGGKIDKHKNIHLLINAFKNLENNKIKLIIFGTIEEEIKCSISSALNNSNIKFIGWIDADKVYDYFLASDLGVFPGTHSVLWEQAVGTGLPCVFKRWDGMQHVDVGGNCTFIENINEKSIMEKILCLYRNKTKYENMKMKARDIGVNRFSYYEIAKRSIEY
ncbi:MAG: glycosyltransferase [Bacillota bacterium]